MTGRKRGGPVRRFVQDVHGRLVEVPDPTATAGMRSPVRCTWCGGVYDVGAVTVTSRNADCSAWTSPCCRRTVDDRGTGWKSRPDIEWLGRR